MTRSLRATDTVLTNENYNEEPEWSFKQRRGMIVEPHTSSYWKHERVRKLKAGGEV